MQEVIVIMNFLVVVMVPSHLLVIIFLTEDSVYMESEADRVEYVLNDFGYIWVGSAKWNEGLPWTFGQVKTIQFTSVLFFLSLFFYFLVFPSFPKRSVSLHK